jgi:hypothetical protein
LHETRESGKEHNRNFVVADPIEESRFEIAMTRIATERLQTHVTVGILRVRRRRSPPRVHFRALDGPVRVMIEADSEDDARCLCREMAFEFICLCD